MDLHTMQICSDPIITIECMVFYRSVNCGVFVPSERVAVTGHIEKLKGLKMLLLQGQLLASWKAMMGHRLPLYSQETFSVLVGALINCYCCS